MGAEASISPNGMARCRRLATIGKTNRPMTTSTRNILFENWSIFRMLWEEADMERIIRESLPDSKEWRLDRLLTSMRVLDEALDDYDSDDDLTMPWSGQDDDVRISTDNQQYSTEISTPQSKG
jgi:hypothetical protein